MSRAYLDWAATAEPNREILHNCLDEAVAAWGNPSSAHREGTVAARLLEGARARLKAGLGAPGESSLVFTGSGTEADQIPLLALLRKSPYRGEIHILVSAIEHPAIYAQSELLERLGIEVSWLFPDAEGFVNPEAIRRALRPATKLVALMAVNNETGAVQDIGGAARVLDEHAASTGRPRCALHVDCVQAMGKIPLSITTRGQAPGPSAASPAAPFADLAGATSAALSAHKIGGPRGVGALYTIRPIETLAVGGGQEKGMRSGTENLFGALSFAACAEYSLGRLESSFADARALERQLFEGLGAIPGAFPLPFTRKAGDPRFSPWIASIAFPGVGGETLVRALSDAGIMVSTGSACSSARAGKRGSGKRRVLEAMGIEEAVSFSAIRVSTGDRSSPEDIATFLDTVALLYRRLKT